MRFKTKLTLYMVLISIFRVLVLLFKNPVICPDSQSYIDLANNIASFNFLGFNGLRTPGYSLIILLSGFNLKIVVILQMIMGIIISYLIASIVYQFTNNEVFSLLASAIYSISIPFLFFEIAILSETTASFFILLSFSRFIKLIKNKRKDYMNVLLISIFTLLAILTRPVYVFMVPLYLIYFIYISKSINMNIGMILKGVLVYIIPILFMFFSWSHINLTHNGVFTFATGRGFAAMEMAGEHIELSPDTYPYNIIKEVYIRERNNSIGYGNPHIDVIWGITDELQTKTGLSYNELSDEVMNMCLQVILQKPEIYIKSFIRSQINFWKTFGLLIFTKTDVPHIIKNINIIQRCILFILQIPFLLAPVVYILNKKRGSEVQDKMVLLIFSYVYVLVVGLSVFISLIECAEGRFAMPTYPLLIIATFIYYGDTSILKQTQKAM